MKQKAEMHHDMSLVRQTGEISVSDFRLFKKNADFGQKNTGFGRKMQTLGRKIRVSAKICLQAFFFCVSIDFAWFRVNKIHAV